MITFTYKNFDIYIYFRKDYSLENFVKENKYLAEYKKIKIQYLNMR